MTDQYTASRVHEILCQADGLETAEQPALLNRIRYLAKRELLQNGSRIDERGTLAFPKPEIFRAAIFCDLAGLTMDVRALEPITDAAARRHSLDLVKPPSLKINGGWKSAGGLIDSIRGVDAGEQWWLTMQYYFAGHSSGGGLAAEFLWDGAKNPDVEETVHQIFGRKPTRTSARIDLRALFGGIIPIVGVPS